MSMSVPPLPTLASPVEHVPTQSSTSVSGAAMATTIACGVRSVSPSFLPHFVDGLALVRCAWTSTNDDLEPRTKS